MAVSSVKHSRMIQISCRGVGLVLKDKDLKLLFSQWFLKTKSAKLWIDGPQKNQVKTFLAVKSKSIDMTWLSSG